MDKGSEAMVDVRTVRWWWWGREAAAEVANLDSCRRRRRLWRGVDVVWGGGVGWEEEEERRFFLVVELPVKQEKIPICGSFLGGHRPRSQWRATMRVEN